jgi:hypothetical protein
MFPCFEHSTLTDLFDAQGIGWRYHAPFELATWVKCSKCREGGRRWLGLVADGAVLGFVVIHGHFKHVVASDANSMNFHGWFLAGPRRCGRMRG